MCFSPQRRAIFRHQTFKKCSETVSFLTFWLVNVLLATAACNFFDIRPSKSACERASRHSGVQFLRIRTSKSAPNLTRFVHFHFEMYFTPQRRAIFAHQNFKKCSDHAVLCKFWLQNVFFATPACNFWFLCWAPTSAPAALTGLLFNWPDTRTIKKTKHFATSPTFGAHVFSFFWLSR